MRKTHDVRTKPLVVRIEALSPVLSEIQLYTNTSVNSILLYLRDTSNTYGNGTSWLRKLKNEYAFKMAQAKQKRSPKYPDRKTPKECKLQGDLLERITTRILQEKGYVVIRHAVENRHVVDVKVVDIPTGTLVAKDNWVMEVSNTNEGTTYPCKRLKNHLKNLRAEKKRGHDTYWLVSHKEALVNVQKELDKIGTKVLEIGSVVLPHNLDDTYDMVKKAIDSEIPDAAAGEEQGRQKR